MTCPSCAPSLEGSRSGSDGAGPLVPYCGLTTASEAAPPAHPTDVETEARGAEGPPRAEGEAARSLSCSPSRLL